MAGESDRIDAKIRDIAEYLDEKTEGESGRQALNSLHGLLDGDAGKFNADGRHSSEVNPLLSDNLREVREDDILENRTTLGETVDLLFYLVPYMSSRIAVAGAFPAAASLTGDSSLTFVAAYGGFMYSAAGGSGPLTLAASYERNEEESSEPSQHDLDHEYEKIVNGIESDRDLERYLQDEFDKQVYRLDLETVLDQNYSVEDVRTFNNSRSLEDDWADEIARLADQEGVNLLRPVVIEKEQEDNVEGRIFVPAIYGDVTPDPDEAVTGSYPVLEVEYEASRSLDPEILRDPIYTDEKLL